MARTLVVAWRSRKLDKRRTECSNGPQTVDPFENRHYFGAKIEAALYFEIQVKLYCFWTLHRYHQAGAGWMVLLATVNTQTGTKPIRWKLRFFKSRSRFRKENGVFDESGYWVLDVICTLDSGGSLSMPFWSQQHRRRWRAEAHTWDQVVSILVLIWLCCCEIQKKNAKTQ